MTAPETRWTAETEEVLAKAFLLVAYQSEGEDTDGIDGDWAAADEENRTQVMAAIRPVLEALADAGLLLPPGGETSQHAEVEYRQIGRTRGGVDEKTYLNWSAEQRGLEFEAALELGYEVLSERTRSVVDWPDGSKFTGPWIEVPS